MYMEATENVRDKMKAQESRHPVQHAVLFGL